MVFDNGMVQFDLAAPPPPAAHPRQLIENIFSPSDREESMLYIRIKKRRKNYDPIMKLRKVHEHIYPGSKNVVSFCEKIVEVARVKMIEILIFFQHAIF